jgi:hypothetical protein
MRNIVERSSIIGVSGLEASTTASCRDAHPVLLHGPPVAQARRS